MTTYAGWQLAVQLKTGSGAWITLNGIQRITFQLAQGLETRPECGTRYPKIVEGNYGLTGTIERHWTGSAIWATFLKGEAAMEYCDLKIHPGGTSGGNPYVQLGGIKFNTAGPTQRPGAVLMTETWAFIGTGSITTGSN